MNTHLMEIKNPIHFYAEFYAEMMHFFPLNP